jgi:hypothetical protein
MVSSPEKYMSIWKKREQNKIETVGVGLVKLRNLTSELFVLSRLSSQLQKGNSISDCPQD